MQLIAVCLVFCLTVAVSDGLKKRFVVRLGGDTGSGAAIEQCAKENPTGCLQVQLVKNGTSCGYAVAAGKIYREGATPRRLTASEKRVIEKYQRGLEEYRKATSNSTNLVSVAGLVTLPKLRKLPSAPQAPCLCSTCVGNHADASSSEQSDTDSPIDVTTDAPKASAVTEQPTETQKPTKRPRRRGGKRRTGGLKGSRKTTKPHTFGATNEPDTSDTPKPVHTPQQDATSRRPRRDHRLSTTESWVTKAPRGTNSRGNGGQDVTIKVVVDVGKAAKRK
ncbi:hypothetical protein AAVH_22061 [Aphelenchoides avenae]|nr:hypothetical protein AAVH_22061 [Aphelenchus avenae]